MQALRYKQILVSVLVLISFFVLPVYVSAHSTVSPSEVTTSKYETFTLSVPTEKDVPTVSIRLLIPGSLDRVTPFVKSGWSINIKKDSNEKVTEIEWIGSEIPQGQKDIFQFTARTPKEEDLLIWKAYQTYQDGEVVAWDRDPGASPHSDEVKNPYSETKVSKTSASESQKKQGADQDNVVNKSALNFSLVALVISMAALILTVRKK